MTTTETTELAERYVATWNEPDAAARRSSLQRLYRSDGRIVTASSEAQGMEQLVAHVAKVAADYLGPDKHRFRQAGTAGHHDCLLLRWEMVTSQTGDVADWGLNLLVIDTEARIVSDYQFVAPTGNR